jgi:hypothetical protein
MRRTFLTLGLIALGGCVGTAEAQPGQARRADGGIREPRFVHNRVPGRWQANCVASVGCARPAELPRCNAGAPATALDDLWAQRFARQGQRVRARGSLHITGRRTRKRCIPRTVCCNTSREGVTFFGAGGHRLELDLPPAGALECVGDDSGECCTTEIPTGEIVAEGTLQPVEDSGGMWRLAGTQVCVVP